MAVRQQDWPSSERPLRLLIAISASVIGLGTILTRDEPAVDLSLVLPTVGVFWVWATNRLFPTWPVYLLGFTIPITLNIVESDAEVSMFLVILMVALLAFTESNRSLVTAVVLSTGLVVFILSVSGALGDFGWPNWLFGLAFAWGAGEVIHRYAHTIAELRQTRVLIADQAALNERRRIARDVHDLVGHSLSVVMLHLTGARLLVRKDPDEAIRALEQAEEAGRASLAEIRRTVLLLREETDGGGPALPSPDLSDIASLVREFVSAGLNIDLVVSGDLTSVDAASALAGYRITQEALTNVTRHTAGADVNVTVTVMADSYEVAVVNRGGVAKPGASGSGFGLISMRERAKSVGGSLLAGPTPSGWSIDVTVPIPKSGFFQ